MGKNPGVAGVLGAVVIGLGHIYLGEWKRLIGLWGLALISVLLFLGGAFILGGLVYVFVYVFSIYDAVTLAG